ncbi:MAG: hypothetical protein ABSA02_24075 [Trebonia sp.]
MDTPTVEVIAPGVTPSPGAGTAPGRAGGPDATPSTGPAVPPGTAGPRELAGQARTRLIRIPAWSEVDRPGDSGPASGGVASTRQRSRPALAARAAPSVAAPAWEQAADDGRGGIASAVLAVVGVCALLGGLAAFAATFSGNVPASPSPAASIARSGVTAPGGQAATGVSGAGTGQVAHGRHDSGRGSAAPLRAKAPGTTRGVTGKPSARNRG